MKVTVIGLGYVGVPILVHAAEAGHIVKGFDIDENKIKNLIDGTLETPDVGSSRIRKLLVGGKISFSSNILDHSESTIFIIAVPTPLNEFNQPDLKYVVSACESISKIIKDGDLIINESTSYIGTLRKLIKPTIEQLSFKKNIEYASAPERIDPGNLIWNIKNTPRVISGLTEDATISAVKFYSSFCDSINTVSQPEVAESSKLFENTFRQVNIALVNEFSEIAVALNFSAHESIIAATSKPFGYMPFYPSIGVGGHCIPVDPVYLKFNADNLGIKLPIIESSNKANSIRPQIIAEKMRIELGGSLSNKKIQVAGIAYKKNTSDIRESPAIKLINELRRLGASVSWSDPVVINYNGETSKPLDAGIDVGIIVTPHSNFDFDIWKKSLIRVFDLSPGIENFGWNKFF
jgi:UDP-N-acetyl-D-glucosamine dehydrogenase